MQELGIVGLGKMGSGLADQALRKGIRVVGSTLRRAAPELLDAGLVESRGLEGLRVHLQRPRAVLLYVPAGPTVDTLLGDLADILEPGDIVADGGNSYWGDSIRRHHALQERGIDFVDVGTSGGVEGARNGACFMVGGETAPVSRLEPMLRRLAVEGGYVHAGPPGAGHFVKLVHNGVEFGMLQAIAEGFDLLTHYHERLPIADVLECWRHGSVVRSWLVDLLAEAYRADPKLQKPGTHIEDTGEVSWLIADALRMEVPVPVIAQSVMQLAASRDDRRNWARAIVLMRHGFGGHPFGPDEAIARERQESRVGDYFRP